MLQSPTSFGSIITFKNLENLVLLINSLKPLFPSKFPSISPAFQSKMLKLLLFLNFESQKSDKISLWQLESWLERFSTPMHRHVRLFLCPWMGACVHVGVNYYLSFLAFPFTRFYHYYYLFMHKYEWMMIMYSILL